MSGYRIWAEKQRGNPLMLFIAVSGIAACGYFAYSKLWIPFVRRRKLAQAQFYGEYIYEIERKPRKR